MRIALFLFFLSGCVRSGAQERLAGGSHLADKISTAAYKSTGWQFLRRSTLSNPLHIYYRLRREGEQRFLDLRVSKAGLDFIVARNEPLKLLMENGHVGSLYNTEYKHSCPGCGNKNGRGDKPGIELTYPIPLEELDELAGCYIVRLRFYTGGHCIGSGIDHCLSEGLHKQVREVLR